ncbi:MAG: hydrogenase expression/formation protein HypE [candidate division Zixibacteria bacterium]|nr:hydrogenase expression/formation protein HypE [candidate division Zixibacteria bacterium]
MTLSDNFNLNCPLPKADYPYVLLAHGGGGRLMHRLIEDIFIPAFGSQELELRHDGARLDIESSAVVMTTDSYVVHPLFFPGGDIGSLAVNGTVNDLAMCGARPTALSAAFIIEEGFPVESLVRVAQSMRAAAEAAGVRIVTGDTKVVDKGRGHGLFITTAGIGEVKSSRLIAPSSVRPGDVILINGDVGRHGIAIMAAREGLEFETTIESDCAPLVDSVMRMLDAGLDLHCLRDLTRGGLATTLVEIADAAGVHIAIEEAAVPVREEIRGACEILGFDPLYVANEGRFIAILPGKEADRALDILRKSAVDCTPMRIGQVVERVPDGQPGLVTMTSVIGSERIIDMLSGEQLPRIC